MIIYQQTTGKKLITGSLTATEARQLSAVMFGPLDWEIVLVDADGLAIESGITSLSVCMKAADDFEGDAYFLCDGDEADTTPVDSALLRALVDGKREATVWVNIRWQLGTDPINYGAPSAIRILNSPHQAEEVGAAPGGDLFYDTLKSHIPGLDWDDETQEGTFPSYTGPTLRMTGNVLEVNVGGTWRQVATLDPGSL